MRLTMTTVYRLGQLANVFLIGVLCGITLYSTIRHAEAYEAERALRPARVAPRALHRGIDLGQVACGWAAPEKALALGWE